MGAWEHEKHGGVLANCTQCISAQARLPIFHPRVKRRRVHLPCQLERPMPHCLYKPLHNAPTMFFRLKQRYDTEHAAPRCLLELLQLSPVTSIAQRQLVHIPLQQHNLHKTESGPLPHTNTLLTSAAAAGLPAAPSQSPPQPEGKGSQE